MLSPFAVTKCRILMEELRGDPSFSTRWASQTTSSKTHSFPYWCYLNLSHEIYVDPSRTAVNNTGESIVRSFNIIWHVIDFKNNLFIICFDWMNWLLYRWIIDSFLNIHVCTSLIFHANKYRIYEQLEKATSAFFWISHTPFLSNDATFDACSTCKMKISK